MLFRPSVTTHFGQKKLDKIIVTEFRLMSEGFCDFPLLEQDINSRETDMKAILLKFMKSKWSRLKTGETTFQFKWNHCIMDGSWRSAGRDMTWTWVGSLLLRAHHVSFLSVSIHVYLLWNQLRNDAIRNSIPTSRSSCCMSFHFQRRNIYSKYWSCFSLKAQSGHVRIDFAFEYAFNGFLVMGTVNGFNLLYFMDHHQGVPSSAVNARILHYHLRWTCKMHQRWAFNINYSQRIQINRYQRVHLKDCEDQSVNIVFIIPFLMFKFTRGWAFYCIYLQHETTNRTREKGEGGKSCFKVWFWKSVVPHHPVCFIIVCSVVLWDNMPVNWLPF